MNRKFKTAYGVLTFVATKPNVKVNWTKYLLLVAPAATHDYILNDPSVVVPSKEYMERLNHVLNKTSPRTITNYVMIHYILSWLPWLEQKYRDLMDVRKEFSRKLL
ncbi:hypothetical protein COOONC_27049 [Cooperia oncophora]